MRKNLFDLASAQNIDEFKRQLTIHDITQPNIVKFIEGGSVNEQHQFLLHHCIRTNFAAGVSAILQMGGDLFQKEMALGNIKTSVNVFSEIQSGQVSFGPTALELLQKSTNPDMVALTEQRAKSAMTLG